MADQSELDASMGRPSSFHTGTSGVAPTKPAPNEPNPAHVKGFVENLKGLLGIGADKEPVHNGKSVTEAVDEAVNGVKAADKPGLDY